MTRAAICFTNEQSDADMLACVNQRRFQMQHSTRSQGGFSLIELLVVMVVMTIIMGGIMTLMKDSIGLSNKISEMTEAQQSLRAAQEVINRDLIVTGDGLQNIKSPRLPTTFVNSYLTVSPAPDINPALKVVGAITSDNQVAAGTAVPGAAPAVNVQTGSDRITILQLDSNFKAISLLPGSVTSFGLTVALPAADASGYPNIATFAVGQIYFFTSSRGSAFGRVTAVNSGTRVLTFNSVGELYGMNMPTSTGPINIVTNGGTQAATMTRMLMINYYVDANGLLHRRTFGLGTAYADSVIAEHVVNLQFRYVLGNVNASGNVDAPVTSMDTEAVQGTLRTVEVTVTTETAHFVNKTTKPQISMTTSTSIRNLQFNNSLQPE